MKIVLLNRYFFPDESATSRMVTSLALGLVRQNWDVHVLASRCLHSDPKRSLCAFGQIRGVTVHRLWTTGFGRGTLTGRTLDYLTFHIAAAWWMLRAVRHGDVCIVCSDPPLLSVTALLPLAIRRGLLVNWIMDLFPEAATELGVVNDRSWLAGLSLRLRNLSLKAARCNVALTERMAKYLQQALPASRFHVINHWSDGDAIRPIDPSRCQLRREWGTRGQDRYWPLRQLRTRP